MTESEEKNEEINNPLPHILEFIRIRIRWDILDIPRKIIRWLKSLGWKIVFSLMNSSMKKSMKNLKTVEKYLGFRDWMFNQIIKYMTENQGWVLAVTRPKGEHLKKHWVQMSFINPQFLEVGVIEKEDGTKVVQSIELLPPQEHLSTDWHIINEEHLEHILKQDRYKKADEFLLEVEENE